MAEDELFDQSKIRYGDNTNKYIPQNLLTNRSYPDPMYRRSSKFFDDPEIVLSYWKTTILMFVSEAVLICLVFVCEAQRWIPILIIPLVILNLLPIIWWWKVSQAFEDWVLTIGQYNENGIKPEVKLGSWQHANEDELAQIQYEKDRFKTNGDHAKLVFAALTGVTTAVILKIVLDS